MVAYELFCPSIIGRLLVVTSVHSYAQTKIITSSSKNHIPQIALPYISFLDLMTSMIFIAQNNLIN